MSAMKPIPDPYRLLGVGRGADAPEIKAAHRRLAKRYHPDAPGGDEQRFLAVQDAYQLLSDPVRRRDWDRRHSARPMDPADRSAPSRSRATQGRWTREDTTAYRRQPLSRRERRKRDARTDGSGRDPGRARHTWSAERVPWWEDFTPRSRTDRSSGRDADEDDAGTRDADPGRARPAGPEQARAPRGEGTRSSPKSAGGRTRDDEGRGLDFDVYSRSSGAAWSMAARRHFRRGESDLPSRGAFRTRGTQVVTGAEARKVAAEEAAARAAAEAAAAAPAGTRPTRGPRGSDRDRLFRRTTGAWAPRQAFDHEPTAAATPATAAPSPAEPRSDATPKSASSTQEPGTTPVTSRATAEPARPAVTRPAESTPPAADEPRRAGRREHDGAARGGRLDGVTLGTLAGAAVAPVSTMAAAGAIGVTDGAPAPTIVLLLIATAIAGAAIGRGVARRRGERSS